MKAFPILTRWNWITNLRNQHLYQVMRVHFITLQLRKYIYISVYNDLKNLWRFTTYKFLPEHLNNICCIVIKTASNFAFMHIVKFVSHLNAHSPSVVWSPRKKNTVLTTVTDPEIWERVSEQCRRTSSALC